MTWAEGAMNRNRTSNNTMRQGIQFSNRFNLTIFNLILTLAFPWRLGG